MFSEFKCNICGSINHAEVIHREMTHCTNCGANARFRAMMVALTEGLLGHPACLSEMAGDRRVRGIGCSDSPCYADRLAALFDYTNTFLHAPPQVDIGDGATLADFRGCQFILCSDVLEHVLCDPARAIGNMYECLAPGGCLIVSAPTFLMENTIEKYPSLRGYSSVQIGGSYAIVYETAMGTIGFDPAPVFHGGPGRVLEIRLFSQASLMALITTAGFRRVCIPAQANLDFGAVWPSIIERTDLRFPSDGRVFLAIK